MVRELHLYSNARAIREQNEIEKTKSGFIPTFLTISDFLKKAVYFDERYLIDSSTKSLLLLEASKFREFDYIKFPKTIINFLSNVSMLESFIDEISLENQEIAKLYEYDFYDDFKTHIKILETLMRRYENMLDKYNLIDKINIIKHQKINTNFIENYDKILLHLDGAINAYELRLYEEINKIVDFEIINFPTKYNIKTTKRVENSNINVKNISTTNEVSLELFECKERLEQIGFVKKQIANFIDDGISPKDIVVILPNENFVSKMTLFDDLNNLNFAMGESFENTLIYQTLNTIYLLNNKKEKYLQSKFERVNIKSPKIINIANDIKRYIDKVEYEDIFLDIAKLCENDEIKNLYEIEVQNLLSIFNINKTYQINVILHLLLGNLSKVRIDDIDGGQITVMGVLESRGVKFEGVIVVDFNDNEVPKRVDKDIFLPDFLREKSNLPTSKDREDLQRNYYHRLFLNAKRVSVSYVNDNEKFISRFANEYKTKLVSEYDYNLDNYLFDSCKSLESKDQKYEGVYDFKSKKLSASKLKTYLSCKRKFYLYYIQGVKEPSYKDVEVDYSKIGTFLHNLLYELYSEQKVIKADELLSKIDFKLSNQEHFVDAKHIFEIDLWKKRFEKFSMFEQMRYEEGYRVFALEKNVTSEFEGFLLEGRIDRVDIKDGILTVLDYKSNDKEAKFKKNETDFQLVFYDILMSNFGEVEKCGYYNLKSSTISFLEKKEEKREKLKEILKSLTNTKQSFDKTLDNNVCKYCHYKTICNVKG